MQRENESVILQICAAEILLGGGIFCLSWKFPRWSPLLFLGYLIATLAVLLLGFRKIKRQVNHTMELVDDTIDEMILHHECRHFDEYTDSLLGKFQSQILRLHQILISYEEREKRQKEQMERSISDLVHQINTPIANLQLYAQLLQQEELSQEEQTVFAKSVQSQAQKLEWLGEGFSKISRLEQEIIQLHPRREPLLPTVLSAIDEVTPRAVQRGNEIRLTGNQHLQAWFDPRWTEEVIFNLLDNGVKYSDPGSTILVSLEEYEIHGKISVTTRGQLPDSEEFPRLFQRFYRSQKTEQAEGVGLGLYLAREVVRSQNGYVKVSSHRDGEITFSVFLRREEVEEKNYDKNLTGGR